MTPKRIAILLHKDDTKDILQSSLITYLAEFWREDGQEVLFLFGTEKFIPADILIVHVDLTIVPDSYLEFAKRYPIVLNGKVKDIRKSTISRNLLTQQDNWKGQVIVKSNQNCAGVPELLRSGYRGKLKKLYHRYMKKLRLQSLLRTPQHSNDYKVYESLANVPQYCFSHPNLVVEKFIPEREGEFYCVRTVSFLGNRKHCIRLKSRSPIVKGNTTEISEDIPDPHPDIEKIRQQLNFDYGKFDYVVLDGEVILLDANKTIGFSKHLRTIVPLQKTRRHRAEGLYYYF